MNMDAHAVAVDIADLKIERLMESQAAGIDGGEIGFVLWGCDRGQDGADFIEAQHGRKALFALGTD